MKLQKIMRYESDDGVDVEFRPAPRRWYNVYVNGIRAGRTRSQSMVRAKFFYRKYRALRRRLQGENAIPPELLPAPTSH